MYLSDRISEKIVPLKPCESQKSLDWVYFNGKLGASLKFVISSEVMKFTTSTLHILREFSSESSS